MTYDDDDTTSLPARTDPHVGIGLDGDAVNVCIPGHRRGFRILHSSLQTPARGDSWPALKDALARLAEHARDPEDAFVALLAPLVQVRVLTLPDMSREETERTVVWEAAQFFTGIVEPHIIAVGDSRPAAAGQRIMAAAAPRRLLDAITAACLSAGWTPRAAGPAELAWLHAARHVWPRSTDRVQIIVLHGTSIRLLTVDHHRISGIQIAADAPLDCRTLGRCLATDRRVVAFGARADYDRLRRCLHSIDPRRVLVPDRASGRDTTPLALAARFAVHVRKLNLTASRPLSALHRNDDPGH